MNLKKLWATSELTLRKKAEHDKCRGHGISDVLGMPQEDSNPAALCITKLFMLKRAVCFGFL